MSTLIVATTRARAKRIFEERGLSPENDKAWGLGNPRLGNLFDRIEVHDAIPSESLEWALAVLFPSLKPDGELVFA